jgi:hypothetical protein
MMIGDVGQGTWEEINDGVRGGNYGWPNYEGPENDAAFTPPFYAYNHSTGGCSVTGVAFYNPATAQFPSSYVGKVLFEDFCQGNIRTLDVSNAAVANFVTGISFPTNLAVAPDGWPCTTWRATSRPANPNPGGGTLSKITYTGSQAPRITVNPQSQTIVLGRPGHLHGRGRRRHELPVAAQRHEHLRRHGHVVHDPVDSDRGQQRAIPGGGDPTRSARRLERGGAHRDTNNFPVATITSPTATTEFASGTVINYAGTGTDVEDGKPAGSAFTWQVDFQHDSHQHPFIPATTGASSGSFTVPDFETEANVWLRIFLTVRDSGGQTNSASRDIFPARQLSAHARGHAGERLGPIERDRSNGERPRATGRR